MLGNKSTLGKIGKDKIELSVISMWWFIIKVSCVPLVITLILWLMIFGIVSTLT